MIHEPECISYDGGHVCVCDIIRSAYQRGREDATKAVEAVAEPFFLSRFNPIDEDAWSAFVDILAAARWKTCTCSCHPEAVLCCLRCMKNHNIAAALGDGEQA